MKNKELNKGEIVIYKTAKNQVDLKVRLEKETILLTQQQVGKLFDVQKAAISKHVNNIFDSGELDKKSTVSILETVQTEGKRKIIRKIEYYNLDLVLSIGYRVKGFVNRQSFNGNAARPDQLDFARGGVFCPLRGALTINIISA